MLRIFLFWNMEKVVSKDKIKLPSNSRINFPILVSLHALRREVMRKNEINVKAQVILFSREVNSKDSHFSITQYYPNMWEPYLDSVILSDRCILESLVELCENAHSQALLPSDSYLKVWGRCPGTCSFKSVRGDSNAHPWLMMNCHRTEWLKKHPLAEGAVSSLAPWDLCMRAWHN